MWIELCRCHPELKEFKKKKKESLTFSLSLSLSSPKFYSSSMNNLGCKMTSLKLYVLHHCFSFIELLQQALRWAPGLSLRIQRWIQVAKDRAVREEWAPWGRTLRKTLRKAGMTQKLAIWNLSHLLITASLWLPGWLQADCQSPRTAQASLTAASVRDRPSRRALGPTGSSEDIILSPALYIDIVQKGFLAGSDSKESAGSAGDLDSIPGSERSPGEGNGYQLQYSYLESSMDRGTWWAQVHGVSKKTWHFS